MVVMKRRCTGVMEHTKSLKTLPYLYKWKRCENDCRMVTVTVLKLFL
jgi:hypothetical protein